MTAPEVPHADLSHEPLAEVMFRHRPVMSMQDGAYVGCQCMDTFFTPAQDWGDHLATVALAALGDTVPRGLGAGFSLVHPAEEAKANASSAVTAVMIQRNQARDRVAELEAWRQVARENNDDLRAERDALAHVIEQAKTAAHTYPNLWDHIQSRDDLLAILDTAPAVSLALRDSEVKAQALDEAAASLDDSHLTRAVADILRHRAATIREEAGK